MEYRSSLLTRATVVTWLNSYLVRVYVTVMLSEKGGTCSFFTLSRHTDNIKMGIVSLHPGEVTRLHQLVSLYQSWTVTDRLILTDLGAEDWSELIQSSKLQFR